MTDEEERDCYARVVAHYQSRPSVRTGLSAPGIKKLYSADKLSERVSTARGILAGLDGKSYIVTGAAFMGKLGEFHFGRECIPLNQRQPHHPESMSYAQRSDTGIRGEHFYDGLTFKCKGVQWLILDGGEVRFLSPSAATAPAQLERPKASQLELF